MLLSNTVISILVLPILKRENNFASITYFTIFMCVMFEVTMLYREYIESVQENLKSEEAS